MKITESYLKARREAVSWLKSKRDFNEGLIILQNSGYKPLIASKIAKWGDRDHSREKLLYEIRNLIQAWGDPESDKHLDVDFDGNATPVITDESANKLLKEADELDKEGKEGDENEYPPVLRKVIYSFSQDYKARSILHAQLGELPEDNSEKTCSQRKVILQSIDALSARMNSLYGIRQRFEATGAIPTEAELQECFYDQEKPLTPDDNLDSNDKEVELPDSKDELKKMRKAEATKLLRARNMLLYQQESKAEVENPIPPGPKRVKYERKIEILTKLVERIDYKIASIQ